MVFVVSNKSTPSIHLWGFNFSTLLSKYGKFFLFEGYTIQLCSNLYKARSWFFKKTLLTQDVEVFCKYVCLHVSLCLLAVVDITVPCLCAWLVYVYMNVTWEDISCTTTLQVTENKNIRPRWPQHKKTKNYCWKISYLGRFAEY